MPQSATPHLSSDKGESSLLSKLVNKFSETTAKASKCLRHCFMWEFSASNIKVNFIISSSVKTLSKRSVVDDFRSKGAETACCKARLLFFLSSSGLKFVGMLLYEGRYSSLSPTEDCCMWEEPSSDSSESLVQSCFFAFVSSRK